MLKLELSKLINFMPYFLMDTKTIEAYRQNSDIFAQKYINATNGIINYFLRAFNKDSRILYRMWSGERTELSPQ